ncbi:hypothetical protein BJ508DRAFT_314026 [Ascobolus immersus RN42]|uniref:Uncharacterized protein n=1 Tax=Ascobolus immersus RN42 TaxID=1160509 RepID=A0A3N4HJT4_ASCIM|nr:hypothetical protein BJ508DRAFT_314026 [Ascobolus immersus RN42]
MTNRRQRKKNAASARACATNVTNPISHSFSKATHIIAPPIPSSHSINKQQSKNTNDPLTENPLDPPKFFGSSDPSCVDELSLALRNDLNLQARTLCGKRLRPACLDRLEEFARFGGADQDWILLQTLRLEDEDDDLWLYEEYVSRFTKMRPPENQEWDGRWCMGWYKPGEQMPWYTKLLHSRLHVEWCKLDDFWGRRDVTVNVHARFGISPDPRSIFSLDGDCNGQWFVFFALNRSGRGAFYWCTGEFRKCVLIAKDEQELKKRLDPARKKPLMAHLPGLVRLNGGQQETSDED